MTGDVTVLISVLALLGLVYQLYLQRTHNEKSLRPLGQIDLEDRQGHIAVYITNNGMGPMIINKLMFSKDGKIYTRIEDCLTLARQSYTAIGVSEAMRKVILPNSRHIVFETRVDQQGEDSKAQQVRQQLSPIRLTVEFRDIYDNKMSVERDFQWLSRYVLNDTLD